MLRIETIPSPNYSSRRGTPVIMLVYHYTASNNVNGTVSWFKTPSSKVSSHYVIGKNRLVGHPQTRVISMVDHMEKAWHAGRSSWMIDEEYYQELNEHTGWTLPKSGYGRKIVGVNACSIGLEYVGTGKTFTGIQMETGAKLTASLMKRYALKRENCVGHEHVSPGRKVDPGPNFDWEMHWELVNRAGKPKPVIVEAAPWLKDRIRKAAPVRMTKGNDSFWHKLLKLFGA